MENGNFRLQVKEVGEGGIFVGLASVYGNVDLGGDVVERGAFSKTLAENPQVPLLWQHDAKEPIGTGTLKDTPSGLEVHGKLVLESDVARKAYALLKAGALRGLSIGYDIVRQAHEGAVRKLKEVRLWEVSLVTLPMNILATVSAVKSPTLDDPFAMLRKEIRRARATQFFGGG